MLSDIGDPRIVETIATNIVETSARPISFEGSEMIVSASVGICYAASGELEEDDLLRNADAALYCAKERGRDRYEVFTLA